MVYVVLFYLFLIQYFYNLNLKIVHFCYFQNTFPFVSMSRQTDDIGKKNPKHFVEQGIECLMHNLFYLYI